MDGRPGSDETELQLRQALSEARLPAAPDTLRASLERLPAGGERATIPRRWWPARALPLAVAAAVLVAALGIGLASRSAAPAATASPVVTVGATATPQLGTPSPTGSLASAIAVIPWVDAGPPPPEGRPTPRPVPPGTKTCGPADLTATAEWEGATATMAGGVSVTNVSATACMLDGPPKVVVIRAGTRTMTATYRANAGGGPAGSTPPGPGLLEPGDRGGWWLFWQNWCGPALVPTTVVVTLPGGGTIVAKRDPQNPNPGIGSTPRCDAPEYPSTLEATAFEYAPPEPPLPPPGQQASTTISGPPTARAGQDVIFTVAITNLGPKPAVFDPCPTYTEDIIFGGLRLGDRSYAVNCAAIGHEVAPGATIVLEMHYPIRATAAPGAADLVWAMDPGGPFDMGAFGRMPITIVSTPAP
jgi:uncharacterized repeat protein (TIGR01451 family)